MSSELLINYRPYETRIALMENGILVEFQLERGARGAGLLGNVYQGKVIRVLPGLQAAFVDIGLDKAAFLYVDDVCGGEKEFSRLMGKQSGDEEDQDGDTAEPAPPAPPAQTGLGQDRRDPVFERPPSQPIETLLIEGQQLLVQVSKEPIGQKGARVTTHISLPGRRLVLMTSVGHLGVSRRIEDEEERRRLRDMLEEISLGRGFIARTAAEGATEYEIKAESSFLVQLWQKVKADAEEARAPSLVHQELDATLKAVRDIFTDQVDRLVIDSQLQFDRIKKFLTSFSPDQAPDVCLYDGPVPLFDAYNVETDLARALNKKVWLKSGGYVVIDSTEALTVIDVNTGRYVGRHNLEETILKTNLEAVREIAYQLRLRNIGGLIVIDFIDMDKEFNRERVHQALKEVLRYDKGKTKVLPMSELGLIEMTRKRTRENIDRLMRGPCFYCQGQGFLLSPASVCHQAFRELEMAACDYPGQALTLTVHPSIRELIVDEGSALEDLEQRLGRPVNIKSDESMHVEAYAIEAAPSPAGLDKVRVIGN
ncbi:MAG: Rne/Rng family ribonuclease [Deltaproteobacteria bacterium]|jgi:ribonuclease G|nr:Rne/Rng family ribonuclease [Deltaproteobacteria bacterium]